MINHLPEGWVWSSIGELCNDPQYGWTTKAIKNGSLHLLRTTDITSGIVNWDTVPYCQQKPEDEKKYLLKDGDIVISRAGSVGYSLLVKAPKQSVFASYLIRFIPIINEKFLAYFLKSPNYWKSISESKIGIAVPNVNATKLKKVKIPLPPHSEQERIVAKTEEFLTRLDAGIKSLKQVHILLKKYRQSVLEKAFRGFLTTMYREKSPYNKNYNYKLSIEIKQYNDTKIGQDIPRRLPPIVLSDLPKLPFGWCWIEAHKICQSVRDGTHDTPKYVEKGIPLVTSKNLKNGAVDISNIQYISEHDYIEIGKRSRVDKDDILYAMIGTIGNPVIVTSENQYSVKNVGIFKTNREFINPSYLKYYLESWFQKRIMESKDLIRGTTQKFVSLGGLRAMPIPYPSVDEQKVIVSEVESRLSIIENTEETIKNNILKAFSLKQSILKHAFEGNLVPQDPNDEPASVLLERIKTEKSKLKN